MSFAFQLYRVLVPKPIRTKLLLSRLQKQIPAYHEASPGYDTDLERKEVVEYVRENGVQIFPYHFTKNYHQSNIEVYHDDNCGLKYVLQDGKKLYFKRKWSVQRIQKSYHDLTLEQDPMSPHRYLSSTFNLDENDVLADFGAAEGNFTLSVIENIKKAYLQKLKTKMDLLFELNSNKGIPCLRLNNVTGHLNHAVKDIETFLTSTELN